MNLQRTLLPLAALLPAAALAACATPVTKDELQQPAYTIELARVQGAEEDPQAQSFLSRAEDHLTQARKHIKNEDHEQARASLTRAQADAEVALGYARLDATRDDADATLVQARNLEASLNTRR